jgi:hypothetical protein
MALAQSVSPSSISSAGNLIHVTVFWAEFKELLIQDATSIKFSKLNFQVYVTFKQLVFWAHPKSHTQLGI